MGGKEETRERKKIKKNYFNEWENKKYYLLLQL